MATEQLPDNIVARYIRDHYVQLLALDGALCEMVGGPPGFTLSGYSYDAERRGLLWPKFWRPLIDMLAWQVWKQRDHCRVTYEAEFAALQHELAPISYT